MNILTHRGINISEDSLFPESSLEAFSNQLESGYGLEFDIQITKDKKCIILHDFNMTRISKGLDNREVCDITLDEIMNINLDDCHYLSLPQIIELINSKQSLGVISALHIKHTFQDENKIDNILRDLEKADPQKIILFDLTPKTAQYVKTIRKELRLAPSVSHHFDIARYNNFVGKTLITANEAIENIALFDWVWLDEWDKTDINNKDKKFYTEDLFKKIRNKGLNIALVTPELHATSPGLLGKEKHPDAADEKILFERIREIIKLRPDAICTDYADKIRKMI